MTKELRGFINRVRRAQDKIYAGKVGKYISIEIDVYQDYICIDACKQDEEGRHEVLQRANLTIFKDERIDCKAISESLSKLSQVVGFDI